MNKIEKVFQVIGIIICLLAISMITFFIVMCIMLARYDECRDIDFEPKYCEKYKDF